MTTNLWAELFFDMNGFDIEANENSEMAYSCNDNFYPSRNGPKTVSQ